MTETMKEEAILWKIQDQVATLTLNRPEVLNSFNRDMARRLQDLLDRMAGAREVRCVRITGAGRAFCAGQDLAEAASAEGPAADVARIVREQYNPLIRRLRSMEKPVVCAVNGAAAGAGANLALACDLVIASEEASFIQAFSKIGLVPDSGGTWVLPRLVGLARATALTFLGETLSARQALQYGLIYAVCPGERLAEESFELAHKLAAMPTQALALTKQALNQSLDNDLETQLKLEEELQARAAASADFREGVEAFLAKRKPKFRGT